MKRSFSDDMSFLFGIGLIAVILFISICAFHCSKDKKSGELEDLKTTILQNFQLNLTKTSDKQ